MHIAIYLEFMLTRNAEDCKNS